MRARSLREQPLQIDLAWLRAEVQRLFQRNRVTEVRCWNGLCQEVTYHAPSLETPQPHPPDWLSRLGWELRLPWQVHYPHQWFWDSCAHAVVLSHLNLPLAMSEIRSLLYAQRQDGFISNQIWNHARRHWVDRLLQVLYPTRHTSPYLQPPALAEAVEAIYLKDKDSGFLHEVLPRLQRYYHFLHAQRCRSDDGLLEIVISYESGKDCSPEYDLVYGESNTQPAWRGPMARLMLRHRLLGWDMERIFASQRFRVKDLLFNCVYAQNLASLARLCQTVGQTWEGEDFQQRAQKVEIAILSKMYDPDSGLFYSLDARHGRDQPLKVPTVSCFLPLMLDSIHLPQVEGLVQHLLDPQEFWLTYPVPAEPRDRPGEKAIWRGLQTWVYPNWYIVRGLRKQAQRFPSQAGHFQHIADQITLKTYELVRQGGFLEFYHSITGQGQRAQGFGWSALVLDMVSDMLK